MASPQWRPGKRVIIEGGGPGSISSGLAFLARGFDVRVFEKQPGCKAIGGAVLLSVPVLAILRSYGIALENFGSKTVTYFKNRDGATRVKLPFNANVNRKMGIDGWHYGMLRSNAFKKMLDLVPEGVVKTGHEFVEYIEHEDSVEAKFASGESVVGDILVGGGRHTLWSISASFWTCAIVPHRYPALPCLVRVHPGHSARVWLHLPRLAVSGKLLPHDPRWEAWLRVVGCRAMLGEQACPIGRKESPHEHLEGLGTTDAALPRGDQLRHSSLPLGDLQPPFHGEVVERPSRLRRRRRSPCFAIRSLRNGHGHRRWLLPGQVPRRRRPPRQSGGDCGFRAVSYEQKRVDYVNHNMEFARFLGRVFHSLPWPLAWVRDKIFDYTPFLSYYLSGGYLRKAEDETMGLTELHVE
jgi:hypothetical protein